MSEPEDEVPDIGAIARSLNTQRRTQEDLQQQLDREATARSSMQAQLSNVEKLLQSLVGKQNAGAEANATNAIDDSNNTPPQVSISSAGTIPVGGGMPEVAAVPTQMNFSRSSSYIQIPKFGDGMSYVEFKQKVIVWKNLVSDSIPKEKQGLMLLGELPTKDKYGGLQGIAIDNVGIEKISSATGADDLMKFLEKRMMEPSFVRLCKWIEKFESFDQKSTWNAERLITEFKTHNSS